MPTLFQRINAGIATTPEDGVLVINMTQPSKLGELNNRSELEATNLGRHPVTEVHDGYIVPVRSLVQTQVILQAVLQLAKKKE